MPNLMSPAEPKLNTNAVQKRRQTGHCQGRIDHQFPPLEDRKFKPNVRKLKKLGLTISLDTGYRLSPRGEQLLGKLTGSE